MKRPTYQYSFPKTGSRWLWKRLVNLLNCLPLAIQIICAGIREEIDKAAIWGKFQLT